MQTLNQAQRISLKVRFALVSELSQHFQSWWPHPPMTSAQKNLCVVMSGNVGAAHVARNFRPTAGQVDETCTNRKRYSEEKQKSRCIFQPPCVMFVRKCKGPRLCEPHSGSTHQAPRPFSAGFPEGSNLTFTLDRRQVITTANNKLLISQQV